MGIVGRRVEIVKLREREIVEARRMLEQLRERDRIGRLPRIHDGYFRSNVGHLLVEVKLAMLGELQRRQRDEALGDRGDAEHRIAANVAIGREVRLADAARPHDSIFRNQRDSSARHVVFFQYRR